MSVDPQALQKSIQDAVGAAATFGEIIAPQYTAYIVLGQAIASAVPTLYDDVKRLIGTAEPTDADKAALAQKIADLMHPETL